MNCPKCDYFMDPLDRECARCHGKGLGPKAVVDKVVEPATTPPVATIPKYQLVLVAALGILSFFGVCIWVSENVSPPHTVASPALSQGQNEYIGVSGHLWTGVKVYYGERKAYGFEVMGGGTVHRADGTTMRGLKVRYPSGSEEWKDRNYIIDGNLFWVRRDDPAITAERWEV